MTRNVLYFLFGCVPRTLTFVVVLSFFAAVPASAGSIVWFASGTIGSVFEQQGVDGFKWTGLVPGTPWSMTMTIDPSPLHSFGSSGTPCTTYGMSTTFNLGGFTYTHSGGTIITNTAPHFGCAGSQPELAGLMHFMWDSPGWTYEPGAWDLAGLMVGAYRDVVTDGSMPLVPTLHPNQTHYSGLFNQACCPGRQFTTSFRPTALTQPTAVPEPASMTLLGAGLVAAWAARRRRRG